MRTLVMALAVSLPSAVLAQSVPAPPDASPVIAAERAFAADYPGMGMGGSFRLWAEPGAIMIVGGRARPVEEVFPVGAPRDPQEPSLEWWPNFAGISRSGDLGFTTGGVAVNGNRAGHYFTVWRRQPDGSWRWVYDGGPTASAADVPGPNSEPVVLTPGPELLLVANADGSIPNVPADWAFARVKRLEAELAREAAVAQKAAHLAVLADEARLYVGQRPPAIGNAAHVEALDDWPETFRFGATEGGGQSKYGDLVWTYGPASWTQDGRDGSGMYVRLWQRQEGGFRIVVAYLISDPPPPGAQ